jgi:predicted nucleotidyltransferase
MDELLEMAQQDDDVLAVLLFGSMARGEQNPCSDRDICLVLKPQNKPYRNIDLSHKRLEYLKQFDLDIQIFQQFPIYI